MKDLLVKFIIAILSFIKDMFCDENGRVSSKRVVGYTAWMVVLVSYYYCARFGKQLPSGTDIIVYSSSAMLGIDSVMKPFVKKGGTKK